MEIVFRVSARTLDSIHKGGVGNAEISGLSSDSFEVNMLGMGTISVSGTVRHQGVSVSGMGRYQAEGLSSRTAMVRVSGMGAAVVRVNEKLTAIVNGPGSIEYIGDPEVDAAVTGTGSVRQR